MHLLAALLALILQQAPQNQLGTIEGIVTRTGSPGPPIVGARVKLSDLRQTPDTPSPFSAETTTDGVGSFSVPNVPPGLYEIEIVHEGFGYPRAPLPDATYRDTLTVAAGQVVQVPGVSLTPAGVIRGQVLDTEGKGMSSVDVELLRLLENNQGRKEWAAVRGGTVRTDAQGAYSKTVYGSGDYYVRAVLESGPVRLNIYHPGTTEGGKAAPVVLSEGSERVADIRIGAALSVESFQISGKVILPPVDVVGAPFIVLVLTRRDPGGRSDPSSAYLRSSSRANDGVGDFEFRDIRPGNYELTASASINGRSHSGKVPIDVRDRDVDAVQLNVQPPFEIKGRMVFDGEPQGIQLSRRTTDARFPGLTEVMLNLAPLSNSPSDRVGRNNPIIDSTGTSFSFQDVSEGEYLLSAAVLTEGDFSTGPLYISDIRADGRSVMDSGFRVGIDPADSLEVVVGTKSGSIEGQVAGNRSNDPALLVLIPESFGRSNFSRYRMTPLSGDGHFQIAGIAPGKYTVFAVPFGNEPMPLPSAEFLTRYASRALSVTVQKGMTAGSLQVPYLSPDK